MTSTSIYPAIQTKTCCVCHEGKSHAEFSKSKSAKDGLQSQCKSCQKLWREQNKDSHRKAMMEWREANQEHYSEIQKQWRENNRDHKRELDRNWIQANKENNTAKTAKYRATKLMATPKWFEDEEVRAIYAQCEATTKQTGVLHHVDHIVPLRSEVVCGLHCLANLQILPALENMSKNNRHWPDMP